MTVLINFIVALLRVLLPALVAKAQDTVEDSHADPAVGDRLQEQIRAAWKIAAITLLCLSMSGCFTRTIYVPHGDPVRLREPLKGVKVWVPDKDGKPVASKMDLPEGWYCLPLDSPKPK